MQDAPPARSWTGRRSRTKKYVDGRTLLSAEFLEFIKDTRLESLRATISTLEGEKADNHKKKVDALIRLESTQNDRDKIKSELTTRIATLEAEIKERDADKVRLDWLQGRQFAMSNDDIETFLTSGFVIYRPTIREAIDAALAQCRRQRARERSGKDGGNADADSEMRGLHGFLLITF